MKLVRIILAVVKFTALLLVALIAFSYNELEVDSLIKGLYIVLFSILAVVIHGLQKEYEEEEEQEKLDKLEEEKFQEEKFQDQLEQWIDGWG